MTSACFLSASPLLLRSYVASGDVCRRSAAKLGKHRARVLNCASEKPTRTETSTSEPSVSEYSQPSSAPASSSVHHGGGEAEAALAEIASAGGGGSSGDTNGGGSGKDDGQPSGKDDGSPAGVVLTPFRRVGEALDGVSKSFGDYLHRTFEIVPPQVLVAMISVVTTLGGTIVQRKTDRRAKERQRLATIEKEKAKIEAELRKNYQSLSICLLKASFKLAERLSALAEHSSGEEPNETDLDTRNGYSPTYSAYLLARYLAAVELLKKRSATLDLGFPAADRIFLNILGRIQGVLSADDRLVLRMQDKERLFKPTPGDRPVPGGPLRVLPRAQLCLGELLLKEHWKMETQNVNADEGPSMNSILSYVEFREMLETDKSLRRWFNPVLQNFRALHNDKKKLDPRRAHEVNRAIGARVYMLQCALMDLVDFLDPGPKPRYVPMFKRRRLRLGGSSYMEEPEMPASLIALYNQLATLRDTRAGTAKMPHQDVVEVFIKSPEGCSNLFMQPGKNGDCPFSQRVLLVLEEMGIPYNAISIDADAKPAWFHLVHPRNQTPVVYHEGQLLIESNQIVTYLINRFPEKTQLADAAHLRLKFGPAKFRRFHPAFVEWLCGRRVSKPVFEKEIRELNDILGQIRICNDGQPFFGGDKFSREDTALVPFLHHVSVAGKSIMGYEVPEDCHFVTDYLTAAREEPSFQKTVAQTRSIVQGYQRLKKTGQMREVALSDSLE